MSQRDARLIGGIYRIGQVITAGGPLTNCTAYNRNTNDVVGLFIVEYPPTYSVEAVQHLLQALDRRRTIQSPQVIHVHDWGVDGNRAYIATDPPRGVTLRYVLDTEYIEMERTLDLARQIAQGLKVLHEHGVVGLDLRPQLITIDSIGIVDRVQLDDIGLRPLLSALGYVNNERVDDISHLDPRYTPPEYINAGQIGPWSDIYQLGLLLFELVTGRLPFVGRTPAETGVMQNSSPVPRMAQFKHDTPMALQDVVNRTLEKNPSQRFLTIAAFLEALDNVQLPSRPLPPERSGPLTNPRLASPGWTTEMPQVDNDTTMRAPRNTGNIPASPTSEHALQGVPTAEGIYAYLCFEKDGIETKRFALTQKNVVVGRLDPKRGMTPDLDLSTLDPKMTVSRQHARIRFEETFFYIEDLKSRNKTRLGELTLTPMKAELLQHGDVIRFGSVPMIFKVPGMSKLLVFKEPKS